jgi:nitrogen regulatory protein P-II 1
MKKLEAIIDPSQLRRVKAVLTDDGVRGLTISRVKGAAGGERRVERYRGAEYIVDWLPKIKLELLVEDEHADYLLRVIRSAACTGRDGDDSIFVLPIREVVRIRTGERGHEAL